MTAQNPWCHPPGVGIVKRDNGKYRAEVYVRLPGQPKGRVVKGPNRDLRREAVEDQKGILARAAVERQQAEEQLVDAARSLEAGIDVTMTVDRWVTAWMPHQKWASKTRSEYDRAYKRVPDDFKQTRLGDITPKIYKAAIMQVHPEGLRRKAHQVFGKAFKEAVIDEYMAASPTKVISVPQPMAPEVLPPTKEQVLAIIANASTDAWKVFFHVAATTGLRRSEMCGLQWIDLDGEHLTVRRKVWQDTEKKAHGVSTFLKTERSRRTISVDPETMRLLKSLPRTSKFVFAGNYFGSAEVAEGTGYVLPDTATHAFTIAATKPNEGREAPTTLHDLRHYHASVLIAAGVDILAVSRRLGHANATMTLKTYGHLVKGRDDGAAGIAAL